MITIRTKDLKSMFDRIIDKLEHEQVEAEEIATDLYRLFRQMNGERLKKMR